MIGKLPTTLFQSTLPREERRRNCIKIYIYWYFNPRSHERSDGNKKQHNQYLKYFNPRSHERSDVYAWSFSDAQIYFNPRSHERSDGGAWRDVHLNKDFNPRSHERSDMQLMQEGII